MSTLVFGILPFPKMYRFANLHKFWAKNTYSEPGYSALNNWTSPRRAARWLDAWIQQRWTEDLIPLIPYTVDRCAL